MIFRLSSHVISSPSTVLRVDSARNPWKAAINRVVSGKRSSCINGQVVLPDETGEIHTTYPYLLAVGPVIAHDRRRKVVFHPVQG
jgi:hypothetical protein